MISIMSNVPVSEICDYLKLFCFRIQEDMSSRWTLEMTLPPFGCIVTDLYSQSPSSKIWTANQIFIVKSVQFLVVDCNISICFMNYD